MQHKVELDREADGRWIAAIPALPGVLAYGDTVEEAVAKVRALIQQVLSDRRGHGEPLPS